jgi:hypothetical protein
MFLMLTLCSSESAKLVFSGNAQLVFYRESSACALRDCSVCVLQGQLSLCSAWSALFFFIVELSFSKIQMLAREELLNLENFVRLFERSACPLSNSAKGSAEKKQLEVCKVSFISGRRIMSRVITLNRRHGKKICISPLYFKGCTFLLEKNKCPIIKLFNNILSLGCNLRFFTYIVFLWDVYHRELAYFYIYNDESCKRFFAFFE